MTTRRRLAAAEAGLGPREVVLAWLAEATRAPDLAAYARDCLRGAPPLHPVDWIATQLAERHGARSRAAATRQVRFAEALREVEFLYALSLDLLEEADGWWQEWWPSALWLTLAIERGLPGSSRGGDPDGLAGDLESARAQATRLVRAYRLRARARRTIEERYFAGRPVRFAQAKAALRTVSVSMSVLQSILDAGADATVAPSPSVPTRREVEDAVTARVRVARAEASQRFGDHPTAIRLLREQLLDPDELDSTW